VKLVKLVKNVFREYSNHKVSQLSAAFAYIAVFSIGPLLLVVISIVGSVLGQSASSGELFSRLSNFMGESNAKTLQDLIANIHQSHAGSVAFVIGAVGLLLGAIGLTNQLQNSFDIIFSVAPDPRGGLKRTIYIKVKNVLLLIFGGLVLAASIVFSVLVEGLSDKAQDYFKISPWLLELQNSAVSFVVFMAVLYLIYRVIPNIMIPRKLVLCCAAVIGLFFLVGKVALGLIIGRSGTASAYGVAASFVTLLLWFYYIAQILMLGAEGLKVYGVEHKIFYKVKRYTLREKSLSFYTNNDLAGRLIEAFSQGFKNKN
jgi:membrane protein